MSETIRHDHYAFKSPFTTEQENARRLIVVGDEISLIESNTVKHFVERDQVIYPSILTLHYPREEAILTFDLYVQSLEDTGQTALTFPQLTTANNKHQTRLSLRTRPIHAIKGRDHRKIDHVYSIPPEDRYSHGYEDLRLQLASDPYFTNSLVEAAPADYWLGQSGLLFFTSFAPPAKGIEPQPLDLTPGQLGAGRIHARFVAARPPRASRQTIPSYLSELLMSGIPTTPQPPTPYRHERLTRAQHVGNGYFDALARSTNMTPADAHRYAVRSLGGTQKLPHWSYAPEIAEGLAIDEAAEEASRHLNQQSPPTDDQPQK